MRVISGEGSGEERDNLEAGLLKLAARANHAQDEQHVLQTMVDGIEAMLDVVCIAVGLSTPDGTLTAIAYSEGNADLAAALNARSLPLSADALVAAAILGATWSVQ